MQHSPSDRPAGGSKPGVNQLRGDALIQHYATLAAGGGMGVNLAEISREERGRFLFGD